MRQRQTSFFAWTLHRLMNYFAHGFRFLDRPYFLAGTAVPDWLNVVNRRAKARRKNVQPWLTATSPAAELAAGIMQHHEDDDRFHGSQAFAELSMKFAVDIRQNLDDERGLRAGFLGHILVEILLDDSLISREPSKLDRYYEALESIDAATVSGLVNEMTTQPAPLLEQLIPRFNQERFLSDYQDDQRLWQRLNHVMRRVKLPALPQKFVELLPTARREVDQRADELIGPVWKPVESD